MHSSLAYWLAALYLPLSARKVTQCLTHFENIEDFFKASPQAWQAIGMPAEAIPHLKNPQWKKIEKDLQWQEEGEQHIICLADADYPMQLKEAPDPPLVLFVRGNKSALLEPQLAIVGARNASVSGLREAEAFAEALAECGLVITSGLAIGIDGAAHRGALRAKQLTVAVSGAGLQQVYPLRHKQLAEDIVRAKGALISEFPLNMPPRTLNFPRRNRIIAGLSLGVFVVEAALKSGSLITARLALEAGREVFAMPGSIHHALSRGCHHLIRQGAKLVETADDILEELPVFKGKNPPLNASDPKNKTEIIYTLTSEAKQILEKINYDVTPLDMILLRSGLTAGELSSILLILELEGYIQSVPGGYIRLNHKVTTRDV